MSEFATAIEEAEVVEEEVLGSGQPKEILLTQRWKRPLHAVVVVDEEQEEERIVTVYEPDPERWSDDYRRRR